jgi:hypothetical protein
VPPNTAIKVPENPENKDGRRIISDGRFFQSFKEVDEPFQSEQERGAAGASGASAQFSPSPKIPFPPHRFGPQ